MLGPRIITFWQGFAASLTQTGGFLLHPVLAFFRQHLGRLLLGMAVLALSAWYLHGQIRSVDWALVGAAITALGPGQGVAGLCAVMLAFVAVAGQERAVVAWLALPLDRATGGRAAMTAAAISQTAGFGPVIGALVRQRMVRGMTLRQSVAISAGMAVGFLLGLVVLAVASVAVSPGQAMAVPARVLLAGLLGLALLAALRRGYWGGHMPNLLIMGRFLAWVAVDLTALALVLWLVLPGAQPLSFWGFLPVFLIGLGLGVMSGSPAGLGPFEATVLTHLPQIEEEALVAAILVFRLLAYLVPLGCGLCYLALGRRGRMGAALARDAAAWARQTLQTLPIPEAHLVRQGEMGVLAGPGGWLWLTGRLAHTRVVMGDPVTDGPVAGVGGFAALAGVQALARAEGRLLCLYKVGSRVAVQARRAGLVVVQVAQEAVLNPQSFTTSGPDRARLRRKLAHARKAGLVIGEPDRLPYDEMDAVARIWATRQGRERGFSVGRYEAGYIAGQRVVLARAPSGQLMGFVSFHTSPAGWVLDLVRFGTDAPDGTIYALLCHAIDMARGQGVTWFSLGAVPAGSFGQGGPTALLVHWLTGRTSGLAQFKSAFTPRWEPRYMAAPGPLSLGLGAAEVARAILHPRRLIPVPYAEFLHYDGLWCAGDASDREEPAQTSLPSPQPSEAAA